MLDYTEIESLIVAMSLRSLSLWGMVLLDPCCYALSQLALDSPPLSVTRYMRDDDRPANEIRSNVRGWIEEIVHLTASTLTALLEGECSIKVYREIGRVAINAPALDWLEPPFFRASKAIYIFMNQMDLMCSELPQALGSNASACWEPYMFRAFLDCIPFVAGFTGVSEEAVVSDAEEIARLLVPLSVCTPDNPFGQQIPPVIVRRLLATAKFFHRGNLKESGDGLGAGHA